MDQVTPDLLLEREKRLKALVSEKTRPKYEHNYSAFAKWYKETRGKEPWNPVAQDYADYIQSKIDANYAASSILTISSSLRVCFAFLLFYFFFTAIQSMHKVMWGTRLVDELDLMDAKCTEYAKGFVTKKKTRTFSEENLITLWRLPEATAKLLLLKTFSVICAFLSFSEFLTTDQVSLPNLEATSFRNSW